MDAILEIGHSLISNALNAENSGVVKGTTSLNYIKLVCEFTAFKCGVSY